MLKTEFFESAVRQGFYGLDRSNLFGKKDNVRRYWEDVFIKISVQKILERLLKKKSRLRIADLGCGSGEGFELLTHVPHSNPMQNRAPAEFVLSAAQIEYY